MCVCGGMVWEGFRDVKGQHTKGARGYGTRRVGGWPGVLHHVGYREEGRPLGRNGHTQGGVPC